MDEYDKCRFCKYYDTYEGCTNYYCDFGNCFIAAKEKIIAKAKEEGISVADVIALMKLEED